MGIYVFTAAFLVDELRRNAGGPEPGHDFGHHVLPRLMGREPVRAFTFSGKGTGASGYWRDVGTVDAYYASNMDLLADPPGLDLYDKAWPVYSFQPSFPPPRVAVIPEPAGRLGGGPRHNMFANGTVCGGVGAGVGGRVRLPGRGRGGGRGQHPVRPGVGRARGGGSSTRGCGSCPGPGSVSTRTRTGPGGSQ